MSPTFARAGDGDGSGDTGARCPYCLEAPCVCLPKEVEFVRFLADLLRLNPNFQDSRVEVSVSDRPRLFADLTAVRRTGDLARTVLIECKSNASFTSAGLHAVIAQIQLYRSLSKYDEYALAFPGRLPSRLHSLLKEERIECWDVDFIASTFAEQIRLSSHSYFRNVLLSVASTSACPPGATLLKRLHECEPGHNGWAEYQRIVGQILELLFCPPLSVPLSESPDSAGINRRDFILPNYADVGLWRFLRDTYQAEYIVVDAKNLKSPVGKHQVLQIANYLKPHGAGMFALIVTRRGANRAAQLTLRELWMAQRKMILVLADETVETMLLAASAGGDPTKVIGQLIQDFRLSM